MEQIIKAGCRKQTRDDEREVLLSWSETRREQRGFLYQRAARDLVGCRPAALHVCRSVFSACVGEAGNGVFGEQTAAFSWNSFYRMESKLQPIVRPEKGEETANNLPDVTES